MNYATYRVTEEKHGRGTFFFTDCCGNQMYSIKDENTYHGKLCPRCLMNGKRVTLFKRGTDEANRIMKEGMEE